MDDDVWTAWDAARVPATDEARLRTTDEARLRATDEARLRTTSLRAVPARLPAPGAIPPRAWLYGTSLVRRFVSVLVAPGGVGKSTLAMAQAVALASGQPILGERVHHSVPVWVLNLEDPAEELDRRLAALLLRHRMPDAAIAGRLFLHSGRTRRVTMAADDHERGVIFPDRDAVIAAVRDAGIGAVIVDPLVKSHGLDENSNPQMDAAITAWADVAEATDAAVLLVHHVRKGPVAQDVDAARGGKALTDAARSASLLSAMSAEEAAALGVCEDDRWRHVRLDEVKANMAARGASSALAAAWYRLESVSLGNGSPAYPNGDHVAAIVRWRAQTVWSRMSAADCNRALDLIDAGPEPGVRYAAFRRGRGNERWAGRVLIEQFGLNEAQAAQVIAAWLKSGLLTEVSYRDEAQRKTRYGVRVANALRPTARASFSEQ